MKCEILTVTPQIAEKILSESRFKNRLLKEARIKKYAEMMINGKWKTNGDTIRFSEVIKENGLAPYRNLYDGQHRLEAIIRSKMPQTFVAVYDLNKDVFDTIDQNKVRDLKDIYYIDDIPNYAEISAIVNNYISAKTSKTFCTEVSCRMEFISKQDFRNEYNSSPEFYQEVCLFTKKIAQIVKSKKDKKNLFFKAGELGGYVVLLHKKFGWAKEYIFEFFDQLCTGSKRYTHPAIKLLRNTLDEYYNPKNNFTKLKGATLTKDYKRAYLFMTWNAYVKSEQLDSLFYTPGANNFPIPETARKFLDD
jgi:hypothetical protein